MKRFGNLIDRIVEPDNLRLAWLKTIRGKSTERAVLRFRPSLGDCLEGIASDFVNGTYRWGEFSRFTIFDPKERQIKVAPLRDRIAYHAICNICGPVFERYQIDQSCACRKGKGQTEAIRLAVSYSRNNNWYLKLDVRKYFDSVCHSVLEKLLFRLFKDQRLLVLFHSLIDSYHTEAGRGIPIGSLTSQYFANHYLGTLDHFVKEHLHCRAYVRYMDDFILWDNSNEVLLDHLKQIENYTAQELRLTLKPSCLNKTHGGLSFLGYRVYPGTVRLSQRSRVRFLREYRKAEMLFDQGIWNEETLARHVQPLFAFLQRAQSREFRLRLVKEGTEP